jgi:Coenzyme PQQ synthesis protein D (PqqD)
VSRLAQSPSIPQRRIGDDVLLAPLGREDFDHLSGTAAVVWTLLETPCTMAELIDELAGLYSASAEGIGTDVDALIAVLIESGAVQVLESTDG